ncbi:MAG: hypothetical protein AAF587_26045 [Bacteroidota bacterium]
MKQLLLTLSDWRILLAFLLLSSSFSMYFFPHNLNKINEIAGKNLQILDTRGSYTLEEVQELLTDMKAEGRELYHHTTSVLDMIYPVVYTIFMLSLLVFLVRNIWSPDSNLVYVGLLPLGTMLFDYLENFNTLGLLAAYPELSDSAVRYGSTMTGIKWGIAFVCLSMMLLGLIGWGVKKIRG